MSMILILENVTADAVVEQNERATIPFSALSNWGSDMLVGRDSENSISLEKAWHGLHFLLTGDPWGGSGYRAFLLCGGIEQGEDMGYGPARLFDAEEVGEIAETLSGFEMLKEFVAQTANDGNSLRITMT